MKLPLPLPWPLRSYNDDTRRDSDDTWVRLGWLFDWSLRWYYTILVAKILGLLLLAAGFGLANLLGLWEP